MALSGKYISAKRAIDRVYQDANLEVNVIEAVEWVGDVLDLIGAPLMLKTVVTNGMTDEDGVTHLPISIVSYRGELPADLHTILGCLDYDSKQALYAITDTFYKSYSSDVNPNQTTENSYTVNNGYIFTGFETGYVELAYSAFRLDEEGFPMIPDDTKVVRAITSYIIERLDYRALRVGRITRDVYQKSYQDRCFDIGSATMRVEIPSIDRMESWKNSLISLVPRLKLHNRSFRNVSRTAVTAGNTSTLNILESITLDVSFPVPNTQKITYANDFRITKIDKDDNNTITIVYSDLTIPAYGTGVLPPVWQLNQKIIAYREIELSSSLAGVVTLYIDFI